MAYISDNLSLITNTASGYSPRVFIYVNATPDSNATIVGAGYITDGVAKGLRVGDIVDAIETGTAKHKRYQVSALTATAATLVTPTAIT